MCYFTRHVHFVLRFSHATIRIATLAFFCSAVDMSQRNFKFFLFLAWLAQTIIVALKFFSADFI